MTKLATALSKGKNASSVAEKAVEKAKKKLDGKKVDLSIVYASADYDLQPVVDTVRSLTDNAPLIGCTTGGEFTEEKVDSKSIAIGLISSDKMKFYTAMAEGVSKGEESALTKISREFPEEVEGFPNKSAIVLIDGLAGKGAEIPIAASNILGMDFILAGGAAADDLKFEKTFVFCDNKVLTDAASVCMIASKTPVFTGVQHGHKPLSRPLKTTKTENNILYEVNSRPAWEVWKEETAEHAKSRGINVKELSDATEIGAHLIRYEMGLSMGSGQYKIRVPLSKNDDGSLNFACTIPNNREFHIMKSEKKDQIESAREAARLAKESAGEAKIAGALIFDCVCRGIILEDSFREAVSEFKNIFGDEVPLLGWETYGEICMNPGSFSGFHNTSSVVLLLPE